MQLWLVRHGESTWNQARRFQGARDAELSLRGHEQAQVLAERLTGAGLEAIYTSPLARACDTATACAARLGLEPTPVDDLREVGLGDWEGLPVETVVERYGDHYWRWLATPAAHPPPGAEPMADLQRRVAAAIDAIHARHPRGRVLVVTHGGVIASYLCRCLGLGLDAIWRLRIDNTSVTRVELPGGRLASLNDTGHLDGGRGAEPPRPAAAGRP
jgi:2,3-bisphosphoglycerate-dependent phosphoglycerate mutase